MTTKLKSLLSCGLLVLAGPVAFAEESLPEVESLSEPPPWVHDAPALGAGDSYQSLPGPDAAVYNTYDNVNPINAVNNEGRLAPQASAPVNPMLQLFQKVDALQHEIQELRENLLYSMWTNTDITWFG